MMLLFRLRRPTHCSMVHLVCLFRKTHLLALLQDNCLELLRCAFLQVVCMREEYNSALSTPTEADKIGCFGRYRYIGKPKYRPIYRSISNWVNGWTQEDQPGFSVPVPLLSLYCLINESTVCWRSCLRNSWWT